MLNDTNNNFSCLINKKYIMCARVLLFAVHCNLYFDSRSHFQIPTTSYAWNKSIADTSTQPICKPNTKNGIPGLQIS